MTDPTDLLDLGSLSNAVRFFVQRWRDGPDRSRAYADAGVEDFETYVARAIGELRGDMRDVGRLTSEFLQRLEADEERQTVMLNLCDEFRREATRERRRMLGDAGVAVAFSRQETRDVARVERTLRLLDPEDLKLLRRLDAAVIAPEEVAEFEADTEANGSDENCAERLFILRRGHLGGSNLIAAGCVVRVPHVDRFFGLPGAGISGAEFVHEGVEVTPLGGHVLRFMGHGTVDDDAQG